VCSSDLKGLGSYCHSGANPFRPDQILAKLEALAAAGVK
jgi:hypothetical protein